MLNPPFLLAVALLGLGAILAGPVASRLDVVHSKAPLELRKPLSSLEADRLRPYAVLRRHVLDAAIIEALGTSRYLNWTLEDLSVPSDDPLRYVNLLVTYYTGGDNLVPHTPDVCYLGAGYSPAQAHENMDIAAPRLGTTDGGSAVVPVRVCTFVKTAIFDREEMTVVYTFQTNGRFTNTRTGVRLAVNDPTARHAYFSKVEVSFPRADRATSVAGARKLFDRLLPILVVEHFPDFAAAEAHSTAGTS